MAVSLLNGFTKAYMQPSCSPAGPCLTSLAAVVPVDVVQVNGGRQLYATMSVCVRVYSSHSVPLLGDLSRRSISFLCCSAVTVRQLAAFGYSSVAACGPLAQAWLVYKKSCASKSNKQVVSQTLPGCQAEAARATLCVSQVSVFCVFMIDMYTCVTCKLSRVGLCKLHITICQRVPLSCTAAFRVISLQTSCWLCIMFCMTKRHATASSKTPVG